MKKLLMLILIGLLVTLSIFIALYGFEIGNIEVLSYMGIQKRNKELDDKIQESSKLAEKDFKLTVSAVEENSKKLQQQKKEYEEMTTISSVDDIQVASQIERYEVETLWVKLGNYATTEGAIMKMDIVQGNRNNSYNLKFTVNGSYISITDFISDIENDDTLGFKIEEFKMLPSTSGTDLQATFVCKDIAIKEVLQNSNYSTETEDEMEEVTNTTSSSNKTNTTNTTKSNTTNRTVNGTNVAE